MSDNNSICVFREWLREVSFTEVSHAIMQKQKKTMDFYPDYDLFMSNIDSLNPFYSFLFMVFRLGLPFDEELIDVYIPKSVVDAGLDIGLFKKQGCEIWMPDTCLLPLFGHLFITGIPQSYPSAKRNNGNPILDSEIQLLIERTTDMTENSSMLEINSDFGILSIIAAKSNRITADLIPASEEQIKYIELNAELNSADIGIITRKELCENLYKYIYGISKLSNGHGYNLSSNITEMLGPLKYLQQDGVAYLLIEMLGSILSIEGNDCVKKYCEKLNLRGEGVVLSKKHVFAHYDTYKKSLLTDMEERFNFEPELMSDNMILNEKNNNVFVYNKLLTFRNGKGDYNFRPLYNPINLLTN